MTDDRGQIPLPTAEIPVQHDSLASPKTSEKGTQRDVGPLFPGIPEAMLLVSSTAAVYMMSYFAQLGFFQFYDIPEEFISVDLTSCIRSAILLFVLLVTLLPHLDLFISIVWNWKEFTPKRLIGGTALIGLLLSLMIWVAVGSDHALWVGVLITAGLVGFVLFVFGLSVLVSTLLSKVELAARTLVNEPIVSTRERPPTALGLADTVLGTRPLIAFVFLIFLLWCSYLSGHRQARSQTGLLVDKCGERAFLARSGGLNIFRYLDPQRSVLLPIFTTLDDGTMAGIKLEPISRKGIAVAHSGRRSFQFTQQISNYSASKDG